MKVNKEILINGILLTIVLALGVLIVTSTYKLPEVPRLETISPGSTTSVVDEATSAPITSDIEVQSETSYNNGIVTSPTAKPRIPELAQTEFKILGERNIFATIIARPTPVPRPTPTPPAPPRINVLLRTWKLSSIVGNRVILTDTAKREEWTMKEGETKQVEYRGEQYTITLKKINKRNFSAVFSFMDQELTLSVF